MLNAVVEALHSHASSAEFAAGLRVARREFITLRGDLFDSDQDYEARLGVFLDWFLCDRRLRIGEHLTSAAADFVEKKHQVLSADELAYAEAFRDSSLRLLLFKKLRKDGSAVFEDVVLGGKLEIQNALAAFLVLQRKQLVEARVLELHDEYFVPPYWMPRPSDVQKIIVKTSQIFRSSGSETIKTPEQMRGDPLRFIHRIAELSNRCNRYPHVEAIEIFKELPDSPLA